jgi:hypothetical protein
VLEVGAYTSVVVTRLNATLLVVSRLWFAADAEITPFPSIVMPLPTFTPPSTLAVAVGSV